MSTPIIQISFKQVDDEQKDLVNNFEEEDDEETIFVEELPAESKNTVAETKVQSNELSSISSSAPQKAIIKEEINYLAAATVTSKMRQFWVNLIEQRQSSIPSSGISPIQREFPSPSKTNSVENLLSSSPKRLSLSLSSKMTASSPDLINSMRSIQIQNSSSIPKESTEKSNSRSSISITNQPASTPTTPKHLSPRESVLLSSSTEAPTEYIQPSGSQDADSEDSFKEDDIKFPEVQSRPRAEAIEDIRVPFGMRKSASANDVFQAFKDLQPQSLSTSPKTFPNSAAENKSVRPKREKSRRLTRKLYTIREMRLERLDWESILNSPQGSAKVILEENIPGFHVENGIPEVCDIGEAFVPVIEDPQRYEFYFRDFFYKQETLNYIGSSQEKDMYILVSILKATASNDKYSFFRAIVRTAEEDKRVEIIREEDDKSAKPSKKALLKELKGAFSYLAKIKLKAIENNEIQEDLLLFEKQQVVTSMKIGVLYCKEGQKTEDEMFSNTSYNPAFEEFLNLLGEVVPLKGFAGFRGGLDVKTDTTGTKSLYTTFGNVEVMFHVAPFLPHNELDAQQVEKKRHLGNDIVVIIFTESSEPFLPTVMRSEFNHVYAVVQPLPEKSPQGKTYYKLAFASKVGVPPFGPLLSSGSVFESCEQFKKFFLTKLLNAERSALCAPQFLPKLKRTRAALLANIAKKFL